LQRRANAAPRLSTPAAKPWLTLLVLPALYRLVHRREAEVLR
jgi:hypothetical protein